MYFNDQDAQTLNNLEQKLAPAFQPIEKEIAELKATNIKKEQEHARVQGLEETVKKFSKE